MKKLAERFRSWQVPVYPTRERDIERPFIGSYIFPEAPKNARELVMPERKKAQDQLRPEGHDPSALSRIPPEKRDEPFWERCVNSLMVFEEDEMALIRVRHALSLFPRNHRLLQIRFLIEERMTR
jgi:hypothetical protein